MLGLGAAENHDGLPQKAGMPQHVLNEIHGSLHAPDNPVIPMSGELRADLLTDLLACEADADLCLAVGTSLAGMNADRVVHSVAQRASERESNGSRAALGAVIVGLQRTKADAHATLRIYAPCDAVFAALANELCLEPHLPPPRAEGEFFRPPVLSRSIGANGADRADGCAGADGADGGEGSGGEGSACYLLRGIPYDAMGVRLPVAASRADADAPPSPTTTLDLREGAAVVIPSGMHAGATGRVEGGPDREGHPRCCFHLNLKKRGGFKAPMVMPVGTWWMQAAVDGSVARLPVVNPPRGNDSSAAAAELRALCEAY